jgi:hypothetical protein
MDKQTRDYMLGSGAADAREGYGDWPPTALAREINKLPRFDIKESAWRPSNQAVAPQAQRERQTGKARAQRKAA